MENVSLEDLDNKSLIDLLCSLEELENVIDEKEEVLKNGKSVN